MMNNAAKRDVIAARLDSITKKHGRLRASDVVRDAENPESPLHGLFEWDDAVAGARYRIIQARGIIQDVYYTAIQETRVLYAPAYVRDPDVDPSEQGYAKTVELATDEVRARAALKNEVQRLQGYVVRVRTLAMAIGLDKDVQRVEDEVARLAAMV